MDELATDQQKKHIWYLQKVLGLKPKWPPKDYKSGEASLAIEQLKRRVEKKKRFFLNKEKPDQEYTDDAILERLRLI